MKILISDIELARSDAERVTDPEQIKSIAESIKEIGLSHPIIVRRVNGSRFQLVSGLKRLLAYKLLDQTKIEAEIRDVDDNRATEIRLHENLKRHNLPWWEQVLLVEELHNLRQDEHGVASSGRPRMNEEKGWSIRDTATELGVGVGSLSEDLNLARALRLDSSLAKVTDKKTAIKLIRVAANRHRSEEEAGLPTKLDVDQVYCSDSAVALQAFPSLSIDHCITDPPWIKFFDASLRIDKRTVPVFKELYRVLKFNSFLYIFCGIDDFNYYNGVTTPEKHDMGELEKIGYRVSKTPILWIKENYLARRGVSAWEYDRSFEFIIVAVKGNPTLTSSTQISGIKTHPIVHPVKMIHPNEKPIALMESIIEDCSYEGNIIIDPFAGSGVVGDACVRMKRRYILIERDEATYKKIQERLK